MKPRLAILLLIAAHLLIALLCGCAPAPKPAVPSSEFRVPSSTDAINPLKLQPPLGGAAPNDVFTGDNAQPAVFGLSQWPTITLTTWFQGMDTNCDYSNQWTNDWDFVALISAAANQPLAQWQRIYPVLTNSYNGLFGFVIITNLPNLMVTAEFFPKPSTN